MTTSAQVPVRTGAVARLRGSLLGLSGSERSVADWILGDPSRLLHLSMSSVAQECGVSDTTVLRMCRTAGFAGYTDLKLALAQDLVRPTQLIHDDIETTDDPDVVVRKVFHANIQALYDTLELLEVADLVRAVDHLEQSSRITIAGVGGSSIVAQALYQRLFRMGKPCDAPQDSQLQVMHASLATDGDVVVGISYSGVTKDIVALLDRASRDGAVTICITGNAQSPAAKAADIVLCSVSHETRADPIAARIAQLTIVDALAVVYALRHLDQTVSSDARFNQAVVPRSL